VGVLDALVDKAFSRFKYLYTLGEDLLPDEEREFCRQWLNLGDENMAFISMTLGVTFHAVSLLVEQVVVARPEIRQALLYFHIFVIIYGLGYFFNRSHFNNFNRLWILIGQLTTVFGYAYVLYWSISIDPVISIAQIKGWTAFLSLGIFIIILCPFHNHVALIYSPLLVFLAWFSWSRIQGSAEMLGISIFAFVGVQVFQRANVVRSFQEARREFANHQRVVQAQKEVHEQELIIARNIQDSFTPHAQFSRVGVDVGFFQIRSQAVGGDWMAVRTDQDGQTFVVIADASGKGVQAALVTHGIQAMWADALAAPVFDAEAWLTRVNNTLHRMGEKSAHSATLGILKVGRGEVEYWSAGHVPAFLFVGQADLDVSALAARGDLIGLTEVPNFSSVKRKFPNREFHLLLGTDGVFEKGTAESPRALRKLLEGVRSNPNYLSEQKFEIDDDRTLVWIRVQPEHLS
jgi:serine phosphatase RsbU (regulator of sigma subunit)